jgi:hypothetical protein
VVDTDIEVGVVTDSGGQQNVDFRQWGEEPGNGLPVLCPFDEQRMQCPAKGDPRAGSQGEQRVERSVCGSFGGRLRITGEQPRCGES